MPIKDLIDFLLIAFAMGMIADTIIAWMANYRYLLRDSNGNVAGPIFSVAQLHGKKNAVGLSIFSLLDSFLTLFSASLIGAVALGLYYQTTESAYIEQEFVVFFLWFGLMRIKRSLATMHIARQFKGKPNPNTFRDEGYVNFTTQVDSIPWVIRDSWVSNITLLCISALFCSLFY